MNELLGSDSSLSQKQKEAVHQVILDQIVPITSLNGSKAAEIIEQTAPELQLSIFEALSTRDGLLYIYLKSIMAMPSSASWINQIVREKYIDLLCVYDRNFLLEYLESLSAADIDIDRVVQILEQYNLVDAIVRLMSSQRKEPEALQKVIFEVHTMAKQLSEDSALSTDNTASLWKPFEKYSMLGVSLCEARTATESSELGPPSQSAATSELMWVDLILATVQYYSAASVFLQRRSELRPDVVLRMRSRLLSIAQQIFSRMFLSTYSRSTKSTIHTLQMWFERMIKEEKDAVVVHSMLPDIFSSYQYYYQLLALAQDITGGELFGQVARAIKSHNRGWRVETIACGICKEILSKSHHSFRTLQKRKADEHRERLHERQEAISRRHGIYRLKTGKKPVETSNDSTEQEEAGDDGHDLISFACGHIVHAACHKSLHTASNLSDDLCPRCQEEIAETYSAANPDGKNGSDEQVFLTEH